ncbi:DUF4747 family protein [uncultured Pseudomonas sp.]|uniref:DUF4747 family protein n=1 Tax=uncultured Pseudomonas sp. TaxID=114707 RepID=UPI002588E40D|nr:DUF4747 family protein [uncultured Pseudomonas sp.]
MACFRIYNIQLLPNDSAKIGEVGKEGYKTLFTELKKKVVTAKRARKLDPLAYILVNDTRFAPFSISLKSKYATGEWIKFQSTDSLDDLYSDENLFKKKHGTAPISNKKNFTFLFDYETHRFAIDEYSNNLPSPATCLEALEKTFEPLSKEFFPDYTLTITLVSDSQKLDEVLANPHGFKRAEAKITFPNGNELTKLLRQFKRNSIHLAEAKVSTAGDGVIKKLPLYVKAMIEAAPDYGHAKITYLVKQGTTLRNKIFSTEKYPLKIKLKDIKNEQESGFFDRLLTRIREVTNASNQRLEDASARGENGDDL